MRDGLLRLFGFPRTQESLTMATPMDALYQRWAKQLCADRRLVMPEELIQGPLRALQAATTPGKRAAMYNAQKYSEAMVNFMDVSLPPPSSSPSLI